MSEVHDGRARFIVLALEFHISWNELRRDKMDPPIHTECFLFGGATTLIFIVDGADTVNFFVTCSHIPWNMVVPIENTTLACKFTRISTMMLWKEVSWTPLEKHSCNGNGRHKWVCSPFLRMVLKENFPLTPRLISISSVIFIKHSVRIKASQIQTKDVVKQSVTFVGGHCLQHTDTRAIETFGAGQ